MQLCTTFDNIVKISKLPCFLSKAEKHLFTAYYPHYKDKLVGNQTCTFVCITSYLYFEYSFDCLGNLLKAFVFVCNSGACIIKPSLVTIKKDLPRILSIYITDTILTTKAVKMMTIDYKLFTFIKYLPENTFDLSQTPQTVKFLPNANTLTNQFWQ